MSDKTKSTIKKIIILVIILFLGYCTLSSNNKTHRDIIKINTNGIDLSFYTIPGITPEDVWGNFKNNGWEKESLISDTNELVTWNMTTENNNVKQIVQIIGIPNAEFISARGTIISQNKNKLINIATNTLGYLASIPYKNSSPANAKHWVEQNINKKEAEKIINGVKFKILSPTNSVKELIIENENNEL